MDFPFIPLRSVVLTVEEISAAERRRTNLAYLRRVHEIMPPSLPGFPSQRSLAEMDTSAFRQLSDRVFSPNSSLGREVLDWLDAFEMIEEMDENELLTIALGAPIELQYIWHFRTHSFIERLRTWRARCGRPVTSRVTRRPGYRFRPVVDAPTDTSLEALRDRFMNGPSGVGADQSHQRYLWTALHRLRAMQRQMAADSRFFFAQIS